MILLLAAAVVSMAQAPTFAADAWRAVQERRADDAERLFQELTSRRPDDPRAWVGFAAAALLRGRDSDARPRLERALALDPGDAEAALLLSDLFFRQSRPVDAIRALERAQAAGADTPRLTARLAQLRAEQTLHAGFNQSLGGRFTVLFEGAPERSLASVVLEHLDAAWSRLGQTLFTPPAGLITVTLYTEQQFADMTRAPAWAAAAFDGRIRLPVRGALDDRAELDRVLTHELAHAFVRAAAPRGVPMWLDEGIASMVEPRGLAWARAEVRRAGRLLPPSRLQRSFRDFSSDEARLAYAQSALLARAIVDRHSTGALNALLADLGRGVPFDAAFRARAYETWPAFVSRFASELGVPYDEAR
ncbi:MAG: tetratricopeptide repeat protein [Acidobacteriota bacterium]|nr:tetratricopeptide repeat protein [Acidobacteriota bacterium]